MASIKIVYHTTDCTCPVMLKDMPSHCDGCCYECGYPKTRKHIVSGNYKRVDYNETDNTFTFGNRKVTIDTSNHPDWIDPVWDEWIDYLEIDGKIIIDDEQKENENG